MKGVRQGCPLSVLLFISYLEDLEEGWKRKNIERVVIGNKEIFCLKFADDIAMVTDSTAGLREMLKELEELVRNVG